jgi:glucokinase
MNNHVIGLDIGGTKIEGIVFDGKKILKSLKIVTPKSLPDLKYSLVELVKFLSAGFEVRAIGAGMAGIVNPQKGVWVKSPNIGYVKNLDFAGVFRQLKIKQVKIDNDANCFVRAEMVLGQGKQCRNVVGMILGTGIGSGIYINGANFRGSHYAGGEVGQLIVGSDTLEHHYQKAKQKGDYGEIARLLSVRLSDLINILDPDCIILGGSVGQLEYPRYMPQVLKNLKKDLISPSRKSKILISRLQSAGSLGAALLLNNQP